MMATSPLINTPISPKLTIKQEQLINKSSSPEISISDEYLTPRSSINDNETSSDSSSTITDHILTEESDDKSSLHTLLTKQNHFDHPTSTIKTDINSEHDQTSLCTRTSSNKTINSVKKPSRKRDRIRSILRKNSSPSTSESSDGDPREWTNVLATTIVSMHQDLQEIITHIEQADQRIIENVLSNNISEPIVTIQRPSFRERQRAKIELIRMAQMLNPPNLLTFHTRESPYPYTDLIEPRYSNLIRIKKNSAFEHSLVSHKPFQHRKFRYRSQRYLLKIRRDLKKFKHDLYGRTPIKSYVELPRLDIQNYRHRLEKTICEVRTQIAEYDRAHSSLYNNRESISQIIAKMKGMDSSIQSQIDDYRTKLRPIEFVHCKRKYNLISAPFIPRRARYSNHKIKNDNSNVRPIDVRFDPTTLIDLNKEAEIFFGPDKPFWEKPPTVRLSVALQLSEESNDEILSPKSVDWTRLDTAFKIKQKHLKNTESKKTENNLINSSNQSNENNDEFWDCITSRSSSLSQQQILSLQNNEQSSISVNEDSSAYF